MLNFNIRLIHNGNSFLDIAKYLKSTVLIISKCQNTNNKSNPKLCNYPT